MSISLLIKEGDPCQGLRNPLTFNEEQILRLIAEGCVTYQIARTVGISENTVKFHVKNIHKKLGVSSRTQAVALALRNGWI